MSAHSLSAARGDPQRPDLESVSALGLGALSAAGRGALVVVSVVGLALAALAGLLVLGLAVRVGVLVRVGGDDGPARLVGLRLLVEAALGLLGLAAAALQLLEPLLLAGVGLRHGRRGELGGGQDAVLAGRS